MNTVTAAVIKENGKILICQRPAGKSNALLWEFPGGKTEPNETDEDCLIRECKEELDITVKIVKRIFETDYNYPTFAIHIIFFESEIADGRIKRKEHNDIRWIYPNEISDYKFCPADEEFLDTIRKNR